MMIFAGRSVGVAQRRSLRVPTIPNKKGGLVIEKLANIEKPVSFE